MKVGAEKMNIVGELEIYNSTFLWQIKNFSSLNVRLGEEVYSPVFSTTHLRTKKLRWQLIFLPAGFDEKNKEYMGLWLKSFSEDQVLVNYSTSILDDKHNSVEEFKTDEELLFTMENNSWGTYRFCRKKIIYDATKKPLVNDTLLISCTITVKSSTTLKDDDYDADDSARAHFQNLLDSGDLSDVTFEIGGKQMRLHKAIVTSLSPVFRAMFEHEMKEKEESVVHIPDVKYDVMSELFRYIYVRKVNGIESIADDLLVAADKYDVEGLRILCESVLSHSLNLDNASQYFELAVNHNASSLKSKSIEFIVDRLEEFVDKREFEYMDGVCKGELLRAIARRNKDHK